LLKAASTAAEPGGSGAVVFFSAAAGRTGEVAAGFGVAVRCFAGAAWFAFVFEGFAVVDELLF
jgi:hypothetical protein